MNSRATRGFSRWKERGKIGFGEGERELWICEDFRSHGDGEGK